ncbi:MAG: glutaredoxin family protein [Acidimicrobiales bacterium]
MTSAMDQATDDDRPDADVWVLTAPGCVGCEPTKELIARILDDVSGITWREIDVSEHPDVAAQQMIMSVPAVIIGGDLAFTGVPREPALREAVAEHIKSRTHEEEIHP